LCEFSGQAISQEFSEGVYTSRANQPLQEIHADVCGPIKHLFGKNLYFILFIDDYNIKTWLYFFFKKNLMCLVVLRSLRY